jgi:AraC-like DNA-binding protein
MTEPIETHIDVNGHGFEAVKYFYCIQTPADFKMITQHLSPNLEMMLIFNFGPPVRVSFADAGFDGLQIERVSAIGPLRQMLNYEVLPGTDLIITVFNPSGFFRLMQVPMDEIGQESIIDPDILLNITGFNDLWQQLKELATLDERINLLKEHAKAFIQNPEEATSPLIAGIPYFNNPFIQPVKAIAQDSNLSERTVQLRFKKYLGYSPKELMRFLRFKQVIQSIQQQESSQVDWYELVEQFGYHDQSHLIKDFKQYLGLTPQKFVKDIVGKEFCVSRPGKYYS